MTTDYHYTIISSSGDELSGVVAVPDDSNILDYIAEAATNAAPYQLLSISKVVWSLITCPGCLENQPNQQAHMEPGGCLYTEELPNDINP